MNGAATFEEDWADAGVFFAAHNRSPCRRFSAGSPRADEAIAEQPAKSRGRTEPVVRKSSRILIYRNKDFWIHSSLFSGISLESLEKTVFPFASCRGLEYR